ncbi:MAG: hypothetical protein RR998_01665 [Oscillospiraceae bacterium]
MIKIVYVYGALLSQYGEYAALKYLEARLSDSGESVEIARMTPSDNLELSGCDLLYIPPGTERSLLEAAERLAKDKSEITSYCENGGLALLTGNASALFARSISHFSGDTTDGLGIFDMDASVIDARRYSEFIMTSDRLPGETIGAINTSIEFESAEMPLFDVRFDAANILHIPFEGAVRGNVFATQLIGPLLVRNPALLDYFCAEMCGHELPACSEDWHRYALAGYSSALATLKKESGAV